MYAETGRFVLFACSRMTSTNSGEALKFTRIFGFFIVLRSLGLGSTIHYIYYREQKMMF